jgi:hypothetical protein
MSTGVSFSLIVTDCEPEALKAVTRHISNIAGTLIADGTDTNFSINIWENEEENKEYHTEETLEKTYEALKESGLTETQAFDAVRTMQNAGILFRELVPEPEIIDEGNPET